jgi:hypothetical protein
MDTLQVRCPSSIVDRRHPLQPFPLACTRPHALVRLPQRSNGSKD